MYKRRFMYYIPLIITLFIATLDGSFAYSSAMDPYEQTGKMSHRFMQPIERTQCYTDNCLIITRQNPAKKTIGYAQSNQMNDLENNWLKTVKNNKAQKETQFNLTPKLNYKFTLSNSQPSTISIDSKGASVTINSYARDIAPLNKYEDKDLKLMNAEETLKKDFEENYLGTYLQLQVLSNPECLFVLPIAEGANRFFSEIAPELPHGGNYILPEIKTISHIDLNQFIPQLADLTVTKDGHVNATTLNHFIIGLLTYNNTKLQFEEKNQDLNSQNITNIITKAIQTLENEQKGSPINKVNLIKEVFESLTDCNLGNVNLSRNANNCTQRAQHVITINLKLTKPTEIWKSKTELEYKTSKVQENEDQNKWNSDKLFAMVFKKLLNWTILPLGTHILRPMAKLAWKNQTATIIGLITIIWTKKHGVFSGLTKFFNT